MVNSYAAWESKSQQRVVIDLSTRIDHADLKQYVAGTYAESWLDAKNRLGYGLSDVQKRLLAKQMEKPIAEAASRRIMNDQDLHAYCEAP